MDDNHSQYDNTYRVKFVSEEELKGTPANTLRIVAEGLDIDSITRVDTLPTNPSEEKIYEVEGTIYYYDNDEWHAIATVEALQDEAEARIAKDTDLQEEIDALEVASDVKDVVGTKSELDNYDTSSLEDNAIIKVLTDETHDDKTSYYRYNSQSDSFIFIGSVSPYYTKSESDVLLNEKVDKVEGKGLSTNDYTDAEKAKLEGIEAEANKTTNHIVIASGQSTQWSDFYWATTTVNATQKQIIEWLERGDNVTLDYTYPNNKSFATGTVSVQLYKGKSANSSTYYIFSFPVPCKDKSGYYAKFEISSSKSNNDWPDTPYLTVRVNKLTPDELTAGNNISITNGVISAQDTTYSAGSNITISAQNEISADFDALSTQDWNNLFPNE